MKPAKRYFVIKKKYIPKRRALIAEAAIASFRDYEERMALIRAIARLR